MVNWFRTQEVHGNSCIKEDLNGWLPQLLQFTRCTVLLPKKLWPVVHILYFIYLCTHEHCDMTLHPYLRGDHIISIFGWARQRNKPCITATDNSAFLSYAVHWHVYTYQQKDNVLYQCMCYKTTRLLKYIVDKTRLLCSVQLSWQIKIFP